MIPFRERNQTIIGSIGIVIVLAMMVGAFKADQLPIIGAGLSPQKRGDECPHDRRSDAANQERHPDCSLYVERELVADALDDYEVRVYDHGQKN